jgi:hypothetical protein
MQNVVRNGDFMGMDQRQIALSVLESLRGGSLYDHLNDESRTLDVADLRQYIYEIMGRNQNNCLRNVRPVRPQWPHANRQQWERSQLEHLARRQEAGRPRAKCKYKH